jgi:hypothetical protein
MALYVVFMEAFAFELKPPEAIGTVRDALLQITGFIQIFRFNTIAALRFAMCRALWGAPHGRNLSFHCPETDGQY